MSSDIITGQYVQISQSPGGVGERIAAQLVDWLVQIAYIVLVATIVDYLPSVAAMGEFVIVLIMVLPPLLYCPLFEILNHGQTLGKRLMKLRVVMKDGSTPSLAAYLLRWLLFIVDGPLISFVGVLFIIITQHHQRIGDLAAGTLVIRLDSYNKVRVSLDEFSHLGKNYRPVYSQAADLSFEQYNLIETTLQLPYEDPRIHQLARKAQSVLSIPHVKEPSAFSFLSQLRRDAQYYMLEDV